MCKACRAYGITKTQFYREKKSSDIDMAGAE